MALGEEFPRSRPAVLKRQGIDAHGRPISAYQFLTLCIDGIVDRMSQLAITTAAEEAYAGKR